MISLFGLNSEYSRNKRLGQVVRSVANMLDPETWSGCGLTRTHQLLAVAFMSILLNLLRNGAET